MDGDRKRSREENFPLVYRRYRIDHCGASAAASLMVVMLMHCF